ncbi:MAG TPA: phospholipase D-like domain-containing protein [Candidatus Saccharimonadales bacterium]|nr:phospholipase D-like domain-containing protein [Candidatus Saccharimonadales bacterium]
MNALQLVDAKEYGEQLAAIIPSAKKRILIAAMIVAYDTYTGPLLEAILQAQKRGVAVHIVVDRFSQLPLAYEGFFFSKEIQRRRQDFETFAAALQKSGGRISYVGKKWSHNPFAGRLHAKFTVVDDTAYTFGGVNFSGRHFGFADVMVQTRDVKVCDTLEALATKIAAHSILKDLDETINDSSQLLFDGGTPGTSVIYQRTCELAAKASKIYYVSQMCPSGKLGRILHDKKAECYFNRPSQAGPPNNLGIWVDQRRFGIANLYKGATYIHAKCMLFEMPDGSKALITGSNNFSWRGIAYGTKEIAMYSTNTHLYDQLYDFMQRRIISR